MSLTPYVTRRKSKRLSLTGTGGGRLVRLLTHLGSKSQVSLSIVLKTKSPSPVNLYGSFFMIKILDTPSVNLLL